MNPMDIRDIKELIIPPGIPPIIFYFASVAILLFAVLFLIYRLKRRKEKTPLLPHEVAYGALERLKKMCLSGENGGKEYLELSRIIRDYLSHRYAVRASEMTTEECLREMKALKIIPEETQSLLQDLLNRCDRVKFAGQTSSPEELGSILEAARLVIDRTRERPLP